MLGDRFSFKADAETVRERPTKNSLKTTEVLLDTDGHVLTKVWYLSRYSSSKLIEEPHKLLMN